MLNQLLRICCQCRMVASPLCCAIVLMATTFLGFSADAVAQSNASTASAIEEVVVTARRREEQIQDVPISIIALSGSQLENRGVYDLNDLTKVSPGLGGCQASCRLNV